MRTLELDCQRIASRSADILNHSAGCFKLKWNRCLAQWTVSYLRYSSGHNCL